MLARIISGSCLVIGIAVLLYGIIAAFPLSLFVVAGLVCIAVSELAARRFALRDGTTGQRDDGSPDGTGRRDGGPVEPTMEVRFRRPDE